MKLKIESERQFWLLAVVFFALYSVAIYFPVLSGRVPLPQGMVSQFPVYASLPRPQGPPKSYADIGDLVTYFYPARALLSRSLEAGSLPLWNPHFVSGSPFLGSSQSSMFYPPNFVYYLFSLPAAWSTGFLIRTFLAAFFMALFVRSIGGSRAAAICSGIIFTSCGFLTAWQGQPMSDAAIWLPFICYAVYRLHTDQSSLSLAFVAIGFAMPVLAGHPETAAHLTLVGTTFAAMLWASSLKLRALELNGWFLVKFAIAGLFAVGLASVQMLPTIEWVGQINHTFDIRWPPLPLHQILGLGTRDMSGGTNSAGVWMPVGAAYIGVIGVLAAWLAPLHRGKKYVLWLAVITVAALATAYGIEPMRSLVSATPILGGLKNERMILIATFGIAALGGLGITVLEEAVPFSMRRRLFALSLLGVAFFVTFLLIYNLQLHTAYKAEFMRRPSFSRSLLFAAMIPLVWRLYGGLRHGRFALLVSAVVVFDIATFAYGYTGFVSRRDIFPAAPAFDFLTKQADTSRFRIIELGFPYSSNAHMMYGLSSAAGYEVALTRWQERFFSEILDKEYTGIIVPGSHILKSQDRRLDMLNVKYLVLPNFEPSFKQFMEHEHYELVFHDSSIGIFENKSVLPRALAVPAAGVEVSDDLNDQLARVSDPAFDPEKSVIVSSETASRLGDRPPHHQAAPPAGNTVEITETSVNEVALRTITPGDSILVLSQMYYPGWKATVDGIDAEVFPVNLALTGIALPGGAHDVRLAFEPLSFRIGAALTLLSAIALGGVIVVENIRWIRTRDTVTVR